MHLFAIYIALLMKCVFTVFAHFVTALFLKISLYILNTNLLSGFANTSSRAVACLFIPLIVYLTEQQLLVLTRFSLPTFFINCVLSVTSKNCFTHSQKFFPFLKFL